MKILSVHLYNIASIEGPFHIDFESEPLKSEGLFAITGATGSGKSTLLDAICLALYNNTPRLAPIKSHINIGDGKHDLSVRDVKTLLRKGAESAFSKVVFKATDHKIYEAVWKIRRARGYGRIQDEVITLENISDKTLFPERNKTLVLKEIQRLLGLSFEQFTKSVILAQGEFANFLKANENERADILEKLTGTEIYSKISAQIFQKNKDLQNEIGFFDTQLASVELLTKDEEEALQTNLHQLKEEENKLALAQKQWQTQLDWHLKKEYLTRQTSQAYAELQIAQQAKNQQQHRFEVLNKVEKIQSLKPIWIQKENLEKQILAVEGEINDFSQKITELQQQTTLIQGRINKEKQRRQTLLQRQEQWLPQIQQARVLDVQIAQKTEMLSDKTQQLETAQQNHHRIAQKIETQTQALAQIRQHVAQHKLWQSQNKHYQKFTDNYSLIDANGKEAERLVLEQEKHHKQTQHLQQQTEQIKASLLRKKTENERLAQAYLSAKKTYDTLKQAVKEVAIENLISEQNRIIKHVERQKSVLNSVQKLQEQEAILRHIRAEKEQKSKQLSQTEEQLVCTQTDTDLARQEIGVLEKLLQKMQMEVSENVENLRNTLTPETPCPVCGATHHPYYQKKREDWALLKIENQLKEVQERHRHLQNQLHDLLSSKKITDAEIRHLNQREEESLALQHREKEKIHQAENDCFFHENDLKASEKTIQADLLEYQNNAEIIIKKIADYRELKHQESTSEAHFRQIAEQSEVAVEQLHAQESTLRELTHRLESVQMLLENTQHVLAEKEQAIGRLLDDESWFLMWKNHPKAFAKNLVKAIDDWQQSQERIGVGEQSENSINQSITHLIQQQKEQKQHLESLKKQWEDQGQQLHNIKLQRQGLLEGRAADQVENQLQNDLEVNQNQIDVQLAKHQENALVLQEFLAKKQTQQSLLTQLRQENAVCESKIDLWMAENPTFKNACPPDEIHHWISLDDQWIHQERTHLKQLEDALLRATTLFKDRSETLELHQNQNLPEISKTDCEKRISESKATENSIKQDIGRLNNQWAVHQKSLEKHRDLLQQKQEKQEVATQWEVINHLIGSSNGKVFQRYAQEFTLDTLLRYANVHLASINPRYQLERIAHTLSLQVVDKEMGYEVRSVYSLSGGESFLVSLGLALALSSLSSTKMNIETLFIDEGFGSLDTQTLAIAMDALESLQHQGKKVGVISHVQEMTERIAVKIEVKKEGNGKSSIRIKSDW